MAKITAFIWLFCIIFLSPGYSQQDSVRYQLRQVYTSEIGVREATGNNDGARVEMYLASAGFSKGYAWCAAYVNWCHLQCELPTPKAPAWSPSWFPQSRVVYSRSDLSTGIPLPGDVFGIYYSNLNRIAHVGFVDDWSSGDWVITGEGNTNEASSREGDGVYRKKRLKRQIYQVASWVN